MNETNNASIQNQLLVKALIAVKEPRDLIYFKSQLRNIPSNIRFIISLPILYSVPDIPYFIVPSSTNDSHIVPYLCNVYLYFIRNEKILLPWKNVEAIDYSVTFDTNFASYITSIIRGKSLKRQQNEIKRVLNSLLINDVNFDDSFYFLENIKMIAPVIKKLRNKSLISPIKFWKMLNKELRWNLVCLEIFRSVDCTEYQKTRTLHYSVSFIKASRKIVNFLYAFYSSTENQTMIEDFLFLQRLILLYLLAIIRIQFRSNKNVKNKLEEFLAFSQNVTGAYLERETTLAYKYFKDRNAVVFLRSINKGGRQKRLLKKIDNIAWDMMAPRFMERCFVLMLGRGDYYIPFFLSFDSKLREMLGYFPVKAVILKPDEGSVLSVPVQNSGEFFRKEGCEELFTKFFSQKSTQERFTQEITDNTDLLRLIKNEYRQLRFVLEYRS